MNRFSFVFNAYTIHIKHDCIRYIRYSHIVIFRQMRQIEIHRTIHTSDKCNVSILFSIHKHTNIIQYIHTHTHRIARYDAWQSDLCLLRVCSYMCAVYVAENMFYFVWSWLYSAQCMFIFVRLRFQNSKNSFNIQLTSA